MPIYVVEDKIANETRLVRAPTSAQAISHLTRQRYAVEAATVERVAQLMAHNVEVEDAKRPTGDET